MSSQVNNQVREKGLLWWGIAAWIAVIAGLAYVLWRKRLASRNIEPVRIDLSFVRKLTHPEQPTPAAPAAEASPIPEVETKATTLPVGEDDLTLLVGIGPKIAGVLRQAGIATFGQLSKADPTRLREVLQAANLRLADPATWPEQARLAAVGKWDELKEYLARVRAGQKS